MQDIINSCYSAPYSTSVNSILLLINASDIPDKDGWEYWYDNITDPAAVKLLDRRDFVPDIESGLRNVTRAFFWGYSLLASRAQMDFIIRTNFTTG